MNKNLRSRFALSLAWSSIAASACGVCNAQTDPVRYVDLPHTDTEYPLSAPVDADAWRARAAALRMQVRVAAGLMPAPARTPLRVRRVHRVAMSGYTVEGVVFESLPGVFVTGNLYLPESGSEPAPAVLSPHGHWRDGRLHHDAVCSVPTRCATLARLGFVVFAYDMIGFGDSRQLAHTAAELRDAAHLTWSVGPFALQTWNSVRSVDFLVSLPEVDPLRIAITGASGGGTQSFVLAAIDDRIAAAAPVNMVSSIMQGGCACENAPGLRIGTNNVEIAATIAPRPMLLVSASGDWTRRSPEVEFPYLQAVYSLLGAPDSVHHAHFDAPHNYDRNTRRAVYRFLCETFEVADRATVDAIEELEPPPATDLQIPATDLADVTPGADEVVKRLRAAARAAADGLAPIDPDRLARLRATVGVTIRVGAGDPFQDLDGLQIEDGLVRWRGRSVRLHSLGDLQSRRFVLVVHPDGAGAATADQFAAALGTTHRVLVIEPFATGHNVPPPDSARGTSNFFTTFNRTDSAEQTLDVAIALAAVVRQEPEQLDLVAYGTTAMTALAARCLVPAELAATIGLRTAVEITGFDAEDDAVYAARLELPNVRRVGGAAALLASAVSPGLLIFGEGARIDLAWAERAAELTGGRLTRIDDSMDPVAVADWLR